MPTRATSKPRPKTTSSAALATPSVRLLVVSDVHFHTPLYQQYVVNGGRAPADPPSRLSTETALGDPQSPFHALLRLVREDKVKADVLVCCGDLTTCADPTAMNLGWLQLHRLAEALKAGEPIVTAGNHDIDSRFKMSTTSPMRMLARPPVPICRHSSHDKLLVQRLLHHRTTTALEDCFGEYLLAPWLPDGAGPAL